MLKIHTDSKGRGWGITAAILILTIWVVSILASILIPILVVVALFKFISGT